MVNSLFFMSYNEMLIYVLSDSYIYSQLKSLKEQPGVEAINNYVKISDYIISCFHLNHPMNPVTMQYNSDYHTIVTDLTNDFFLLIK